MKPHSPSKSAGKVSLSDQTWNGDGAVGASAASVSCPEGRWRRQAIALRIPGRTILSAIEIYRQLSSESLMLSSDVVHHLLCHRHHSGWSLAHVMMRVHYNLPPAPGKLCQAGL